MDGRSRRAALAQRIFTYWGAEKAAGAAAAAAVAAVQPTAGAAAVQPAGTGAGAGEGEAGFGSGGAGHHGRFYHLRRSDPESLSWWLPARASRHATDRASTKAGGPSMDAAKAAGPSSGAAATEKKALATVHTTRRPSAACAARSARWSRSLAGRATHPTAAARAAGASVMCGKGWVATGGRYIPWSRFGRRSRGIGRRSRSRTRACCSCSAPKPAPAP